MDEMHGTSKVIVEEAKRGVHKLLMTSRPYGATAERDFVDLEVFHKGVSDTQMRSYAQLELSQS